ncbi:alpha/beta hydrolase-fold protein [Cystobacter fuscus]|uniref:carboxylesterase family protein n=1 Tax=Cystobacter fuscus TaxID=43 RepID=UPI0037C02FD3
MGAVTMVLVAWLMTGTPGQEASPPGTPGSFVAKTLTLRGVSYSYSVYLPPHYRPGQVWPVILALHGANSRGTEGTRQRSQRLAAAVRLYPERYPALLVLPQCPPGADWSGDVADFALQAVDKTLAEYGGDRRRVYLTGESIGAQGALRFAARFPERFAAVVSVSERSADRSVVERLKGVPLWMWHGDADKEVPVSESRAFLELFKAVGNTSVRYTELPGLGHDIFDTVYLDEAVSTWLFAQRRSQ